MGLSDSIEEQLRTELEIVKAENKELERENKSQKIWLDMYEKDAADLLEEHGLEPDDKVDREVLKRMLNCLIGKNRQLITENEKLNKLFERWEHMIDPNTNPGGCANCFHQEWMATQKG